MDLKKYFQETIGNLKLNFNFYWLTAQKYFRRWLKKVKINCLKFIRIIKKLKELNVNFFNNLSNYFTFLKLNREDDFIFLLLMLKTKIENMKNLWRHASHENYLDEYQKLEELSEMLTEMIKIALEKERVEKDEKYQKLSKSFFNKLHRLHDKLYLEKK